MADRTITQAQARLAMDAIWQIDALLETLPPALQGHDKFSLIQAVVVRAQQLTEVIGNVIDGTPDEEAPLVVFGAGNVGGGQHAT